jgi:hypothetical protein
MQRYLRAKRQHLLQLGQRLDFRYWQILLQKDFAHLGEQHSLKVRRACATLIQKSIRSDSIVGLVREPDAGNPHVRFDERDATDSPR